MEVDTLNFLHWILFVQQAFYCSNECVHGYNSWKQPRTGVERCGGVYINTQRTMCCDNTVYIKSGHSPSCCGKIAYDAGFFLCCSGTVVQKIGQIPRCCADQAYDALRDFCYNGYIHYTASSNQRQGHHVQAKASQNEERYRLQQNVYGDRALRCCYSSTGRVCCVRSALCCRSQRSQRRRPDGSGQLLAQTAVAISGFQPVCCLIVSVAAKTRCCASTLQLYGLIPVCCRNAQQQSQLPTVTPRPRVTTGVPFCCQISAVSFVCCRLVNGVAPCCRLTSSPRPTVRSATVPLAVIPQSRPRINRNCCLTRARPSCCSKLQRRPACCTRKTRRQQVNCCGSRFPSPQCCIQITVQQVPCPVTVSQSQSCRAMKQWSCCAAIVRRDACCALGGQATGIVPLCCEHRASATYVPKRVQISEKKRLSGVAQIPFSVERARSPENGQSRVALCGSRSYDRRMFICCQGVLRLKFGIKHPLCCGNSAFDAQKYQCCDGVIRQSCSAGLLSYQL